MTHSTDNYSNCHGNIVHDDFRQFVENEVVSATGTSAEEFWTSLARVVSGTDVAAIRTPEDADSALYTMSDDTLWCSLYETLYHDGFIPHSAGLKPGTKINRARLDRVAQCSKDFLDKSYPLKEGSHREAVSYMVYFQNLLVILADGSTTGLQHPKQFIGKNGPTNEPESIMLDHNGMLIEIQFDANGKYGKHDLANIEDIQLESDQLLVLELSRGSIADKCANISSWIDNLKNGQSGKTFSQCDGENICLARRNWAIHVSDLKQDGEILRNSEGFALPDSIAESFTAAWIYFNNQAATNTYGPRLNIFMANANGQLQNALMAALETMPTGNADENARPVRTIKVLNESADIMASSKNASALQQDGNSQPTLNKLVSRALESHGYNLSQAAN